MKLFIGLGVYWLISAALRIPSVDTWTFLSHGNDNWWFDIVGVRVMLAVAFFEIATLRRQQNDHTR